MLTLHPFTTRGKELSAGRFPKYSGACAAIGFFDGVHRGHRYLIEQVKSEAARRGLSPVIITFEEHPRLTLSPGNYWPELITTNEEKLRLLGETGIDAAVMLRFDLEMSKLTSQEFMEQILKNVLGVECLVMGYDHHFGSDLSAGFVDYVKSGRGLGIEVLREREYNGGEVSISSSAVRRFLCGGNVDMARACLDRPYTLAGLIVEGHHEGGRLGFPTANLRPDDEDKIVPGRGVYAVRVEIDGFCYDGMLNIGWRPTLDNGEDQSIEAHLFDFDGSSLYGQRLTVHFVSRVRDERKFPSVEALKAQLQVDALKVREILSQS